MGARYTTCRSNLKGKLFEYLPTLALGSLNTEDLERAELVTYELKEVTSKRGTVVLLEHQENQEKLKRKLLKEHREEEEKKDREPYKSLKVRFEKP